MKKLLLICLLLLPIISQSEDVSPQEHPLKGLDVATKYGINFEINIVHDMDGGHEVTISNSPTIYDIAKLSGREAKSFDKSPMEALHKAAEKYHTTLQKHIQKTLTRNGKKQKIGDYFLNEAIKEKEFKTEGLLDSPKLFSAKSSELAKITKMISHLKLRPGQQFKLAIDYVKETRNPHISYPKPPKPPQWRVEISCGDHRPIPIPERHMAYSEKTTSKDENFNLALLKALQKVPAKFFPELDNENCKDCQQKIVDKTLPNKDGFLKNLWNIITFGK